MSRAAVATAFLLLALLASSPAASATTVRLDDDARIVLDRGLAKSLRQSDVEVKALEPGALKLAGDGKRVVLRKLQFDGAAGSIGASVAGKRIVLARLANAKSEPAGFDTRVRARRLPLTRAGAGALNRVLGLPEVLKAGRSLGSLSALAKAAAVPVSFGTIAIGGPDTVFSKLESLRVQMGIWGATQRWSAPGENFFLFSIAPTTVAPDASAGVLEGADNDGVTMQIHEQPPREMLLRDPRIDLSTRELSATLSPISTESPVTMPIATLDYGAATFQIRPKVGAFELMHIRAISSQAIADQLNQRFATPGLFQPGETLARITVNLHAG